MNCERFNTIVDAWIDGELDAATDADAERHASSCPDCAREAASIAEIVRAARDLPRSVEPERDLYPAIRRTLAPPARPMAWLATAASVALLTTAVWLGLQTPEKGAASGAGRAELAAAGAELERASDEMSTALPATAIEPFDDGLAVVDGAIAQARAAIDTAPDDPRARRALNQLYRTKLDLLWRASRRMTTGA